MPKKPSKATEFNLFLEFMESGAVEYLYQVAEIIGVDAGTISDWKKLPQVQEAQARGIKRTMAEMEKAGKRDWRMWESKLKMLGISGVQKTDITSGGEKITPIYGGQSVQGHNGNKEVI